VTSIKWIGWRAADPVNVPYYYTMSKNAGNNTSSPLGREIAVANNSRQQPKGALQDATSRPF
jgi:hypothetical protein